MEEMMRIDSMEMARAWLAQQYAVSDYLFDRPRKINLIDIGQYEKDGQAQDRLAVRFHVDEKIPAVHLESIGRSPLQEQPILDIPTMVIEGKYRPHQWSGWGGWRPWPDQRLTRCEPLCGGMSIGAEYYGSGTLGGIVRDRLTRQPMILSNWHVLVVNWGAWRGQRIYQPGRSDWGTDADLIATLERDAMAANLDAAVAIVNSNRRLSNDQLGIGPARGVGRAAIGMQVEKSGRSSGWTSGRVTGVGGVQRLTYGWLERVIRDVVTIDQLPAGGQVSAPGDSGSWWINSATREAIGLHFAGSDEPERALALDMQEVLDALNVEIDPRL